MGALCLYCCGAWSINLEHQLAVIKNTVCLYFYSNPPKQTHYIHVCWGVLSWGRYLRGRLLPMWPPSTRHLYTQLIFQTSNLSSLVTGFSGAACSHYTGWTFYGDVFCVFFLSLIGLQDLTVTQMLIPAPWRLFFFFFFSLYVEHRIPIAAPQLSPTLMCNLSQGPNFDLCWKIRY